jgi:hypothetical protein
LLKTGSSSHRQKSVSFTTKASESDTRGNLNASDLGAQQSGADASLTKEAPRLPEVSNCILLSEPAAISEKSAQDESEDEEPYNDYMW